MKLSRPVTDIGMVSLRKLIENVEAPEDLFADRCILVRMKSSGHDRTELFAMSMNIQMMRAKTPVTTIR
jgi:hypothetical protein